MTKRKPHNRSKGKNPQKSQAQLIYGLHAVRAVLDNPQRKVRQLWASANAETEIRSHIKEQHPKIQMLNIRELSKIIPENSVHQGIIAEVEPLPNPDFQDILAEGKLLLALDQINDPGNMGAILRSAAAFGVGGVAVPRHNSPQNAMSLAKAASGALEIVPLVDIGNLSRSLQIAQKAGYIVVGLDEDASITLDEVPKNAPIMCVMGAEGKGLRRLTTQNCDYTAKLPLNAEFSTLNVSAATAIALYILTRP
ncbi:MAG: 23S rRNA (guanosine(2251)-2'-O)-methyltransferase RlmB [Alphaproteobacteria bacterium]|nr:23S rRNA (guanosine(2251)-2'-O)-methyltransferase RlmB [Alphaproteobacteria bacterium]